MKVLTCDGRTLEVRDAGPVRFRMMAREAPIKAHGCRVVEDVEARALVRKLIDSGLHDIDKEFRQ